MCRVFSKFLRLSACLFAFTAPVFALEAGLFNSQTQAPSPILDFETVSSTNVYKTAQQYLRVEAPENHLDQVRLFSNKGEGLTFLNADGHSLPLYWREFSEPQQGLTFSAANESTWKKIGRKDADPALLTLQTQPGRPSYIYFGTKVPGSSLPTGEYRVGLALEVVGGAVTPEEMRPQEDIITPNGDGINDVARFGVSGSFQIKIFNRRGGKVRTLDNVNVWDGRDDSGALLENGVYIYQVQADQKVSGMIGVER